jgi:large subunit ribosomal protein L28
VAGKCDICGKGPSFGHNVSHSHHKTNREFRPNIQRTTIYRDGKEKRVNLCTRCLRTLYKQARTA